MLVCARYHFVAHETAGASAHPAFPVPFDWRGRDDEEQTSGETRCEIANPCLLNIHNCHHPRKRVIQYAATSRLNSSASGILDHPLSRMMTVGYNVVPLKDFSCKLPAKS